MFWAPSRIFESSTALETSDSAVNGGQITMSTSLMLARARFRSPTRSSASATVLFIFQFPAMIILRSLSMLREVEVRGRLSVGQGGNTGQNSALEKFQARAAAGAHKSDAITKAGIVESFHAVAAADDAFGSIFVRGLDNGPGNGKGAFRKAFVLEHSHRSVPENGFGFANHF